MLTMRMCGRILAAFALCACSVRLVAQPAAGATPSATEPLVENGSIKAASEQPHYPAGNQALGANAAISFNWVEMGPRNLKGQQGSAVSGKLQALAWLPSQPEIMYVGGGIGSGDEGPFTQTGVFKTSDRGLTWSAKNVGLTDTSVNVLWIDRTDPSILLSGSEFGGLFRTADAAESWARVSTHGPVSAIADYNGGVLAGTSVGLEFSDDHGKTWRILQATPAPVRCMAVRGQDVIVGLGNGEVLWKGQTDQLWRTVASNPQAPVFDVALDPIDSAIGYYGRGCCGTPNDVVYYTRNRGASWTAMNPPNNGFSQTLGVRLSDRAFLVAGQGMFHATTDFGVTWSALNAPWDSRKLFVLSDSKIAMGSDHGLHWSDNNGQSWTDLTGSITCNILFGATVAGKTILTSAQDFSALISTDGGVNWRDYPSEPVGEGGSVAINPGDPRFCYAFTTAGFALSRDGCQHFTLLNAPERDNWVSAANASLITVDARTPSTVYVGARDGVWQSIDWGVHFQRLTWPLSQVTQVIPDPKDASAVYICSKNGLYQTLDAGRNWVKLNLPGGGGYPYSAAVSPVDNKVILVALNGGAGGVGGGVLRSTDRGQTFLFANVGLTSTPYNLGENQLSIAYSPIGEQGGALLTLATTRGMYLSSDDGQTWQDIRFNATPRFFSQGVWNNGYLYVTTAGQGILRSDRQLVIPAEAVPQITSVRVAYGAEIIAQNTWIEIHGMNLVPRDTGASGQVWSAAPEFAAGKMPTQLGGVTATLNGKPAYIYFVCSAVSNPDCANDQINALTPLDDTVGSATLIVTNRGRTTSPFSVNISTESPSLLKFGATEFAVGTHADFKLIGPVSLYPGFSTPALPGEPIVLFGSGFGLPAATLTQGAASQFGPLAQKPTVTVAGVPAEVTYAGVVSPGLYQLNITVPGSIFTGNAAIAAQHNRFTTSEGSTIAIKSTNCNGQQAPAGFGIFVVRADRASGVTEINGGDARQPQVPFTWDWDDGTITQGFFTQQHTYADTTKSYVVQVVSHEKDGSSYCASTTVSFR